MKIQGRTYKQRVEYQIDQWVKGKSIHNDIENECCPDFSCCKPEFLASEEMRKTFQAANEDQRFSLCGTFLSSAISNYLESKGKRPDSVMIIDGKTEIESPLN